MKLVKCLSWLLAFFTVLVVVASCGRNGQSEDTTGSMTAPGTTEVPGSTAPDTDVSEFDELPEVKYDGDLVSILNNQSNFAYVNLGELEQTGEGLDDAIYFRNLALEDELGITISIESLPYNQTNSTMNSLGASGEYVFDFYTLDLNLLISHIVNGYVYNANDIKTLSLDHSWWNQPAIESIQIGSAVYAFFGDMHLGYYEAYDGIIFNKQMIADLQLENPYDLVHDDNWTLDKMSAMMSVAKANLDGSDEWTVQDRYPYTAYDYNSGTAFLHMAGASLIERDENNYPVFNGLSDEYVDVYESVLESMLYNDTTNNAIRASGTIQSTLSKSPAMFHSGRALFILSAPSGMRTMSDCQFDVGIVPLPKYNEEQENYNSYIFMGANAIAIPAAHPNAELAGVVLEYMSAYSQRDVRSIYFDRTLAEKYAQEEDAREMLDIILRTGSFDLMDVYGWGGNLALKIMNHMIEGNTDIASLVGSNSSVLSESIDNTLKALEALEKE